MTARRVERSRAVRITLAAVLCAVAIVLCACPATRDLENVTGKEFPHGSTDTGGADTGPADSGVLPDAGGVVTKAFVFTPAAGVPTEGEVRIVSGSVKGDVLTVHLGTGGFSDVYGMYFRLTYDPAVLTFKAIMPNPKFPADGLVRTAQRRGMLIAGITNKGDTPSLRFTKDEEIAAIEFRIVGNEGTDLAFIPEASGVHDKYLQNVALAWTGGKLEYR